jgi:DNA polymerase-3 subunit gamma/tau
MSYVVFARKWRPLTFEDVVGQEHITETLKKAIEKNRVAHAYIFTGTRGVGKTTSARIMARALNCEQGPTANPCGVCTACKNILSGSSFDVIEIDGASNNSVDDIRELRENIGYSSMGGKYRIFVIDEVHMLTKSAFNALLKTLEEPPKNVIFILATTEPQKIPATIHSRCQRYDFKRIGAEQILSRLIHICTTENIKFERSALMLVARKADGSMRDSLSLLDQVYSFCQENLTEKEVRNVLGLVGLDVFNIVMDAIATKTAAPALNAIQDVLYQGFDLQEFLLGLQEHIRNLLFARIPGALAARGVEIEDELAQQFIKSASRFSEGDLLRMSDILKRAEYDLKWSAFPRFHVEITILKLVFLDSTISIEELISMVGGMPPSNDSPPMKPSLSQGSLPADSSDDLKKKLKIEEAVVVQSLSTPVVNKLSDTDETVNNEEPEDCESEGEHNFTESKKSAEQLQNAIIADDTGPATTLYVAEESVTFAESAENDSVDFKKKWTDFIDVLFKEQPTIGSFMSIAIVVSCTDDVLSIKFPQMSRFQYMEVTKKQNKEEVEKLLKMFLGKPVELQISLETRPPDAEERSFLKQVGQMPSTINDEIENEPIIQTILDVFDGEVLN